MRFGERLRQERLRRHLSQEALAEALNISPRSIARWEKDRAIPQASVRLQLSRFFGVSFSELFEAQKAEEVPRQLWSVPSSRNPFFTGREILLQHLQEQFHNQHNIALSQSWALSGLGGIGKTQLALEYAYRYRQHYRFVFWTRAATRESLLADLVDIAQLVGLPERAEPSQEKVLQAVKQWFATHDGWLWVLDNADDMEVVREVVPAECPGHLLLTTRAQALGTLAQRIEVQTMGMAEATLFLLRRAKLLAPDSFLDSVSDELLSGAEAIIIALDFLPLALDQAGAYIEEVGCSLSDYLQLYGTHRAELLQRRGRLATDHPDSVTTTWSLSFEYLEQHSPTAAELLRMCAFLEPDAIPEELLSEGSVYLSLVLQQIGMDSFAFNNALEALRRFSLIQRHPDSKTLRIHRLVQAVLKDAMTTEGQRQWAERAVRAVNAMFPGQVEVATWPGCQRFLAQAQACSALIQSYALAFEEAASLLFRTAVYLQVYALYEQAEFLYQQALRIREQSLGPKHPGVARVLSELANLYRIEGKYGEAEPLFQQAMCIWEQTPEPDSLDLALGLYNLAQLYLVRDKHEQAEELYQRSLRIQEHLLGPDHPHLVDVLNGLGNLYRAEGMLKQAEPILQRALSIQERTWGPDHPAITNTLISVAGLFYRQGRYEQAEPLFQRALDIRERTLGPEHPEVAAVLNPLASFYCFQGKYEQAEPLCERALHIREQALGPDHIMVAAVLRNLADSYRGQGKYEQAEPVCLRAIHIWEKVLGPDSVDTTFGFQTLAMIYSAQGKYEQAESLYQRALHIQEQMISPDHPVVAYSLEGLANLYREQGKYEQAELLYQRVLHIWEQRQGLHLPDLAETLANFAALRRAQGKHQEAASLYQRALAVREQALGPEHQKTVDTRLAYIAVLRAMGRYDEAEQVQSL